MSARNVPSAPLGERDQFRALVVLAGSCGASRVADLAEARAGFGELHRLLSVGPADVSTWVPVVGGFLGAGLVRVGGPRIATAVALVLGALGAALASFGHGVAGGVLSLASTGAFTVGSLAFAGDVLVPGESDRSPSRFAGMACFVFARAALMDLGSFVWSTATSYGDRGSSHLFAAALKLTAAVLVFFAARPSTKRQGPPPVASVYRASHDDHLGDHSELGYPGGLWETLRPLVLAAMLFEFGSVGSGYVMAGTTHWLVAGFGAAAGAAFFFRAWRRRKHVALVALYARALMFGAGGWVLVGMSSAVGALMFPGAIVSSLARVVGTLSFGLVALAGRGRRAALPLAGWLLLTNLTTVFGNAIFGAMPGMLLIPLGVVAIFVGPGLRRIANAVEARLTAL